jgi:hypothetical protein
MHCMFRCCPHLHVVDLPTTMETQEAHIHFIFMQKSPLFFMCIQADYACLSLNDLFRSIFFWILPLFMFISLSLFHDLVTNLSPRYILLSPSFIPFPLISSPNKNVQLQPKQQQLE